MDGLHMPAISKATLVSASLARFENAHEAREGAQKVNDTV